jgi:hypothetical protein
MEILHILNGDSTLFQIKKTSLQGDFFIWREILCEGEITSKVGTNQFWQERERWMAYFSQGGTDEYQKKFKNKFQDLDISAYAEIILWFEYDLFCQINLIAVLSWLDNLSLKHTKTSLVVVGEQPNHKKMLGLGEINGEEYPILFEQRVDLAKADLSFATEIWDIYRSSNHDKLIGKIKKDSNSKFKYLLPAFKAHLNRFPQKSNGLSKIENNIAEMVKDDFMSKKKVVGQLLREENYYGFGDLQYFDQIDHLSPIFTQHSDKIKLNQLGKSILSGKQNFMDIRVNFPKYGGADIRYFRWIPKLESLEKNNLSDKNNR